MIASVLVSVGADMEAIARIAGSSDLHARSYAGGRLYVAGVTQESLDAAAARPEFVNPPPPARIVTGEQFLALWLPPEIAAAFTADPRLMAGAMKVLAQNGANLDSPECAQLLGLAVQVGAISAARRDQIIAGIPPGA